MVPPVSCRVDARCWQVQSLVQSCEAFRAAHTMLRGLQTTCSYSVLVPEAGSLRSGHQPSCAPLRPGGGSFLPLSCLVLLPPAPGLRPRPSRVCLPLHVRVSHLHMSVSTFRSSQAPGIGFGAHPVPMASSSLDGVRKARF